MPAPMGSTNPSLIPREQLQDSLLLHIRREASTVDIDIDEKESGIHMGFLRIGELLVL